MASKWLKNKPKMKDFPSLRLEPQMGGLAAPVTQIFLIWTSVQ